MAPKRSRRLLGAALVGRTLSAGLLLAGSTLAGMFLAGTAPEATAGEVNYVKSVSHDAIAGVRLDEEVVITFNSAVLPSSVGPDTILIRTGSNNGEQANGRYVIGRFLYDRGAQRRVVIRPEAIQEYFQLIRGLSRSDATRKSGNLISRIEKTGKFKRLRKIDAGLLSYFGSTSRAGTRLDDEFILSSYPVLSTPDDPLHEYRLRIAGDDELWTAYQAGDANAYTELSRNSEFERFFHPVDAATGAVAEDSVLRSRQYRQVLIDRRNGRRVMFVPNIPIRSDLDDTGFDIGRAYSLIVPSGQPGVFNTVLTRRGRRPLLQGDGRDFSTLFTTIPNTGGNSLFLDNEARIGIAGQQKPRVINQTPPNGETAIDRFTDWEDPDNNFLTAVAARRTFTVRLRFAQPLDPRSVNPTTFLLTKTAQYSEDPSVPPSFFQLPVAVGTFLNQHRLGIVEVELTPANDLDPLSDYTITVSGTVRSLGGAFLEQDETTSFRIGAGDPPLSRIYETFADAQGMASPIETITASQITTARWAPGELYDPNGTGLLVASFMPFLGDGQGAPADPLSPPVFDPGDPDTFPVTDLDLTSGEQITFVTEGLDPSDPDTFGEQIEYDYHSVSFVAATATAIGRHPLVIRSQTFIRLEGSGIFVNGLDGQPGLTNTDTVSGPPTGGLGGQAGPGGYRGGNGAYSPAVDENNAPILDPQGNPVFEPARTDGQDGQPGYLASNQDPGGGGAGGFSGLREEGTNVDVDPPVGDGVDPELSPERISEPGGGGGHATVGGNADAARGTQKLHPGGYNGGIGGTAYGFSNLQDQGLNADNVPTLSFGSGGAGGGGGGGEDDPDVVSGQLGTIGPEDSGGGGGGGGGGALHLVARDSIEIDGSVVDCSGGLGGDSQDASNVPTGKGAAGGGGSGGTFWAQCYGRIDIVNGSTIDVGGGPGGLGQISPDPPGTGTVDGFGGQGAPGYIRLAAATLGDIQIVSSTTIPASTDTAAFSMDVFRPVTGALNGVEGGSYPSHKNTTNPGFSPPLDPSDPNAVQVIGVPMVENISVGYTRWFNSQLDTPTYVPVYFDPLGSDPAFGTKVNEPPGSTPGTFTEVEIMVRSADDDRNNTGNPLVDVATPWTPLADAEMATSDRRYIQGRFEFTMPFSFDFTTEFASVDIFHLEIELQ